MKSLIGHSTASSASPDFPFEFLRESGMVLFDHRVIQVKVGTRTEVEFDFMDVWQTVQRLGASRWSYLYLVHTHEFSVSPSPTDLAMYQAWKTALKPLIYIKMGIFCKGQFRWAAPKIFIDRIPMRTLIEEILFPLSYKLSELS